MDNELLIVEKQAYLQQEIVDKNYDTSDFLIYLTEIKGEKGIDIDFWTLSELKPVN